MTKMEVLNREEVYTLLQLTRGRVEDIDMFLSGHLKNRIPEEKEYWFNQKQKFIELSVKLEDMTHHSED